MNGGDPLEAWAKTKAEHPAPGELVGVGREQLDELATFLERQAIITLPPGEPITVAPTPEFYRWSFASMWTPGPFESKPTRAYYYLTDVDPSWPAERQDEHLRDYNYPTLWSISIHEVYPGHFLHYQHLRRVESKARKSIMFAPASFVEGWAHYCEQMMIEAGFGRQDHGIKLGQLAEALIRLVRFIVCIKLHAEDMSVEQGVRLFRDEAYMEESERAARSRARHVRSDLSGLHRRQADAAQAAAGLQAAAGQGVFAAHVSRHAARPRHRAVLAPSPADARRRRAAMLDSTRRIEDQVMPLYEYECDACGHRFEKIQKFSDPLVDDVPEVRRPRAQAACRRRRFSSRAAASTSPTTPKKDSGRRRSRTAARRIEADEGATSREVGRSRQDREERQVRRRAESSTRRRRRAATPSSRAPRRRRIDAGRRSLAEREDS